MKPLLDLSLLLMLAVALTLCAGVAWASCTDGERRIDGVTEHSAMPCTERVIK
jgi:hypothetical protein